MEKSHPFEPYTSHSNLKRVCVYIAHYFLSISKLLFFVQVYFCLMLQFDLNFKHCKFGSSLLAYSSTVKAG